MNTVDDLPVLPAIVRGTLVHRRADPVRHAFRNRVYQWLVDLDEVPAPRGWRHLACSFDASDHLGGTLPGASADIRTNVERFLVQRGIDARAGRMVMLANSRVLGYVFNPLTVFWCFAPDGNLLCAIAEVHNTYGERHAYLVRPGGDGRAEVNKEFYVSPFNDVSGRYAMQLAVTGGTVRTTITLHRPGRSPFVAIFTGTGTAVTASALARTLIRYPLMPQRVSLTIRLHGLWLWARRLPVVKRLPHVHQDGVA